jgi:hypothetical protein
LTRRRRRHLGPRTFPAYTHTKGLPKPRCYSRTPRDFARATQNPHTPTSGLTPLGALHKSGFLNRHPGTRSKYPERSRKFPRLRSPKKDNRRPTHTRHRRSLVDKQSQLPRIKRVPHWRTSKPSPSRIPTNQRTGPLVRTPQEERRRPKRILDNKQRSPHTTPEHLRTWILEKNRSTTPRLPNTQTAN